MIISFKTAILLAASVSLASAAPDPRAFLEQHCIDCHGEEKQKGDVRLDSFSEAIETIDDLETYQDIVDMLNLQDMPPEDEPQPSDGERAAMIDMLTNSIAEAHSLFSDTGGHSALRRLNSWEYRQTIGDLLELDVETWNPAENFPAEAKVDGFDNNGAALVTSGMLLDHYFAAAEEAIKRSTQFTEKPTSQFYSQQTPFYFDSKEAKDLPKLFQLDRFRFTPETPYTDLYGRHYRGGHIGFLPLARGGAPHSGRYTVRVRAAAVDRFHPYEKALSDIRRGDPLVLELAAVDRVGSSQSSGNVSAMHSLATVELTNEEPQWFEWEVYLEKGYEPEIRFRNGPVAAKRLVRVTMYEADNFPDLQRFKDMESGTEKSNGVLKAYRGPKLRIYEIQVEGPHVDSWPPVGHQRLYAGHRPDKLSPKTIDERLRSFATEAFRRPLNDGELQPIENLVHSKIAAGMDPIPALQLGFQTLLCSPSFLYLSEGEGELDDYALASRLSYFLWSAPPDRRLLQHAAKGRLANPKTLGKEVDRMLANPKSRRFDQHFIRRWLDLDNIGEMPPSDDFLSYYRDGLEGAMRTETETFFRHILDNNLPPSEFLEANYSFLNRELALHYGIDQVEGESFRKVSLAKTPRGGLMGHGSFLTASANGVDTSPVIRGIYVLEKILGYSPPPPPDDVPAIEPDVRGATTIREQMAKHREIKTCAECHRKIDPLGFALENFDPIGGWRAEYGKDLPIDATGNLPNGDSFSNVPEFHQRILDRQDQFARGLTEKLLSYALGRELEIGDRPEIDRILQELDTNDHGFRDLIRNVALSEPFRNN